MDVVSYALAKKYVDDSIVNIAERGQADWNQNDPVALDYVKNRPFYEMPREVIYDGSLEFKLQIQGHNPYQAQLIEVKKPFEVGKIYIITINGEECLCVCEEGTDGNRISLHHNFLNGGYGYIYNSDSSWNVYMQPNGYGDFTIHLIIEEADIIHKLDEKFIPDTIARVSDILGQSQSDWNQNDHNAKDYVKNRPFYSKTNSETASFYMTGSTGGSNIVSVSNEFITAIFKRPHTVIVDVKIQGNIVRSSIVINNSTDVQIKIPENTSLLRYLKVNIWDDLNGKKLIIRSEGELWDTCDITVLHEEIYTLDEKYLPKSIARVNDIDEAVTADSEIIDVLIQEDMLFAFTDSTGFILTDENNNILTW